MTGSIAVRACRSDTSVDFQNLCQYQIVAPHDVYMTGNGYTEDFYLEISSNLCQYQMVLLHDLMWQKEPQISSMEDEYLSVHILCPMSGL